MVLHPGEQEGSLVELETRICLQILSWGWPDLGTPSVLSHADSPHFLQTVKPEDGGWYPQHLSQHDMPKHGYHINEATHALIA